MGPLLAASLVALLSISTGGCMAKPSLTRASSEISPHASARSTGAQSAASCTPIDRRSLPGPPAVSLGRDGEVALGMAHDMTWHSCSDQGIFQADGSLEGPTLAKGPLRLRLAPGTCLLSVGGASYEPGRPGWFSPDPASRTFLAVKWSAGDAVELGVPPPGRWAIAVSLELLDEARGVQWHGVYWFGLTMGPKTAERPLVDRALPDVSRAPRAGDRAVEVQRW